MIRRFASIALVAGALAAAFSECRAQYGPWGLGMGTSPVGMAGMGMMSVNGGVGMAWSPYRPPAPAPRVTYAPLPARGLVPRTPRAYQHHLYDGGAPEGAATLSASRRSIYRSPRRAELPAVGGPRQ